MEQQEQVVPPEAEESGELTARQFIDEVAMTPGTYRIELSGGRHFDVREIVDYSEIVAMRKRAAAILKICEKSKTSPNSIAPAWRPYARDMDFETASMVAELSSLIVSPKFKEVEVMELAKKNGAMAAFLQGKIRKRWAETVPAAEAEELEETKND